MSFLAWEVAALQQLTLPATAASVGRCSSVTYIPTANPFFFSEEDWVISQKPFFAEKQCLEKACLSLCFVQKIARTLLVLPKAALLPRKPPGSSDEASGIFLVSL